MEKWMFLVLVTQRHRFRPRPLWGQGWRKGVVSLKKKFSPEHFYLKEYCLVNGTKKENDIVVTHQC
jgi:hypothetical protein